MATKEFTVSQPGSDDSTPLAVDVKIEEQADGSLKVTLKVADGYIADLRGFFFDVSDNDILPLLTVTGEHVNGYVFDPDGGIDRAAPPPPEAIISPLSFEFGIELGTPGIGNDDIQETTFFLSRTDGESLTLDLLKGESVGIRAESVGEDREGSSKLQGEIPENGDNGNGNGDVDLSFSKEIAIDFEFNFDSEVNIELNKEVNVEVYVQSEADVTGNVAIATFSAEAIGTNTFAQADVHVLAIEGLLSSVDGVLIAATG